MKLRYSLVLIIIFCFAQVTALAPLVLGVENIPDDLKQWMSEHPVAVVAHHMSKNHAGVSTITLLRNNNANIVAILAPEHGFSGVIPAEKTVTDTTSNHGIPILSLYKQGSGKKVDPVILDKVDGIVVDLQDVGMRHFTYTATLFSVLKSAAEQNKRCIVLDRPNPLGLRTQGPIPSPDMTQKSFLASVPVPLRHGLTIGELSNYLARHHLPTAIDLVVVPMQNYRRGMECPESLVAGISPNLPTRAACYCYSFLGLLGEVRPFDVGVGTPDVFTLLCLPSGSTSDSVWQRAHTIFKNHGVESTRYSYFNGRKKKQYDGLRLTIADINQVNSFAIQQELLQLFKKAGVALVFSPHFDVAAGAERVRVSVQDSAKVRSESLQDLTSFQQEIGRVKLYL